MCVSTAIVSWLKTVFKTTLAVFLPTLGSDSRASRELGTKHHDGQQAIGTFS